VGLEDLAEHPRRRVDAPGPEAVAQLGHDVGARLARGCDGRAPAVGQADEADARAVRGRAAGDIAEALELRDRLRDGLLGDLERRRERGDRLLVLDERCTRKPCPKRRPAKPRASTRRRTSSLSHSRRTARRDRP
jgi:hypothetical protein